jgi:hypothetical protein
MCANMVGDCASAISPEYINANQHLSFIAIQAPSPRAVRQGKKINEIRMIVNIRYMMYRGCSPVKVYIQHVMYSLDDILDVEVKVKITKRNAGR